MENHNKNTISRRYFLKQMGIGLLAVPSFNISHAFAMPNEQLIAKTKLCMGTLVTIKASHTNQQKLQESLAHAFSEINRLEAIFSRHDEHTPLAYLNTHGTLHDTPHEMLVVLQEATHIEKLTNSAFNPAILPILQHLEKKNSASPKDIKELMALVDTKAIHISDSTIKLKKSGMQITLDGIAKGYIVDQVAHILDNCGIEHYLINAGGDMRAKGLKYSTQNEKWIVAIEDPKKQAQYPRIFPLHNQALATSGSYEKNFAHGWHHLITPDYTMKNAHSPQIQSVSVLAPNAMQADAYATAFSCMPTQKALNLSNSLPHIACLIIAHNGTIHTSKSWLV